MPGRGGVGKGVGPSSEILLLVCSASITAYPMPAQFFFFILVSFLLWTSVPLYSPLTSWWLLKMCGTLKMCGKDMHLGGARHTHTHTHTHMYLCIYVCVHARAHPHVCMCVCARARACSRVRVRMRAYACVCVRMRAYACVCMRMCNIYN